MLREQLQLERAELQTVLLLLYETVKVRCSSTRVLSLVSMLGHALFLPPSNAPAHAHGTGMAVQKSTSQLMSEHLVGGSMTPFIFRDKLDGGLLGRASGRGGDRSNRIGDQVNTCRGDACEHVNTCCGDACEHVNTCRGDACEHVNTCHGDACKHVRL